MKLFDFSKLAEIYKRFSKREKTIFYATAAILSILILDQLVIRPILGTFHSLNQEVRDLESSIKKSVRLLAQKDRMMNEVKLYSAYSVQAKSAEEEIAILLKHIEELANQSSVNLLYVKPAQAKADEQVAKYFVNLEAEGQMEQILNFFYEIENSKLLLRTEKYAMQPTAKGSSVVKVAATISRTIAP